MGEMYWYKNADTCGWEQYNSTEKKPVTGWMLLPAATTTKNVSTKNDIKQDWYITTD